MTLATSSASLFVSSGENVSPSGRPHSRAPTAVNLRRKNRTATAYVSKRTPPEGSLYDVLRVESGATCREIKRAYRRLARVVHPDVNGESESSCYEFVKVHEAYATLSDPERRAHYDRILLMHRLNSASGYGGYGGTKNWESDQCW